METNCTWHRENETIRAYVKYVRFPMYGQNMFTVRVATKPDENGNTISQHIVPGFMLELDDDVKTIKSNWFDGDGKMKSSKNPVSKLYLYSAARFAIEMGLMV